MTVTSEFDGLPHWAPEDMTAAQYEYTTYESLEPLDTETLETVAAICENPKVDSTNCVPCRAFEILAERREVSPTVAPEQPVVPENPSPPPPAEPASFQENPEAVIVDLLDQLRNHILALMDPTASAKLNGLTSEELAALVVASARYVALTDSLKGSGMSFETKDQLVIDKARAITARLL